LKSCINILKLITVFFLLISDVLNQKYGKEKIKKVWQAIVDACNQKCRDSARHANVKSDNLPQTD
jgi:ketosteroid isomerase-like protein